MTCTEWKKTIASHHLPDNAYRVTVGSREGNTSLGRLRSRWEDNIKMDLNGVSGDPGDWLELSQDREQRLAYLRVVINIGFLK